MSLNKSKWVAKKGYYISKRTNASGQHIVVKKIKGKYRIVGAV